MPRFVVGTTPKQASWLNAKRFSLTVQFVPSSVIAGNTGLIFGKWGSAPVADLNSNTWDFVLNPGAADGTNLDKSMAEAPDKGSLWLVSDTADQVVNLVEENIKEREQETA